MSADERAPARFRGLWLLVLLLIVGGGLGYYFTRGRPPLPFEERNDPLQPIRTLKAAQLQNITQLEFYPDGEWLVGGHGAVDLIAWDVETGNEVTSTRSRSSDGSELHRRRFQSHKARGEAFGQFRAVSAAAPAGPPVVLPPALIDPVNFGRQRPPRPKVEGGVAGFGWTEMTDRGMFCAPKTEHGPRVIGYSGTEYSWDAKEEYDPGPPPAKGEPERRVKVTEWRFAVHALKPGGSSYTASTYVGESPLLLPRGFSADGTRLLLAGDDGTVALGRVQVADGFSLGHVEPLPAFKPGSGITVFAMLPDGKTALIRSKDSVLGVWNLETATEVRRLFPWRWDPAGIAVSRDGRKLVADSDGNVKIWDLGSGAEVARFAVPKEGIRARCFSPDGSRLLIVAGDKTLRLCAAEDGKEIKRLASPDREATALTFSADSAKIAVAFGKEVQIWQLP